jgi:hypothetical protein
MSVIGERDPAQVRPYALTAGRTHGGEGLAIETLVSITPMGRDLLPACAWSRGRSRCCASGRWPSPRSRPGWTYPSGWPGCWSPTWPPTAC